MQQIKNIVKGPYEPQDNTVIWIDTSNPDAPIQKAHVNGAWRPVGESLDALMDNYNEPSNAGKVLQVAQDGTIDWVVPLAGSTADSAMSDSSTNAPQNKVVKAYVDAVGTEVSALGQEVYELSDAAIVNPYYIEFVLGRIDNSGNDVDATNMMRNVGFIPLYGTPTYTFSPSVGGNVAYRYYDTNQAYLGTSYSSSAAFVRFILVMTSYEGSITIRSDSNTTIWTTHKYLTPIAIESLEVININRVNNKNDGYARATLARDAVPINLRKTGGLYRYLLSDGWYLDQFIGTTWTDSRTSWRLISAAPDSPASFMRFPASTNYMLNGILKELYLPSLTTTDIGNIKKVRIYKDYSSSHYVGVDFFGTSDAIIFRMRASFSSSALASAAESPVFTLNGKDYALIDWDAAASGYTDYESTYITLGFPHATDLAFNPTIRQYILTPIGETKKDYFADANISPYWAKQDAKPVIYEADGKSSSNYIVNSISFPDGTIIAARRGGSIVKIALDATETTLLSISGASDWRCLWMDSALNVYASPHSAYDGSMSASDRGLYKMEYGQNNFTKVISLYDSGSSIPTEAENNDDTIWTMCEDRAGNLYAGVYAHTIRPNPAIYKSTDGGDTWVYAYNFVTSGLAPTGLHIHSIIYNEYNDALYVIVGEKNTIFKSTDGASTFVDLDVQCEKDKGTCMLAVPDGIIIGSDYAYDGIMSKLYSDDKTIRTTGHIWANTIFALRRSDVTGWIYAFTEIDSAVNVTDYYPPIEALTDPSALATWVASSPSHLAAWQAYNTEMDDTFPEDAIRPQHCSILVSRDNGETWEILYAPFVGSTVAAGFRTTGQFRNGECLTGNYKDVSSVLRVARPLVISEGKHKYGVNGLNLDGEILIRTNTSDDVTPL